MDRLLIFKKHLKKCLLRWRMFKKGQVSTQFNWLFVSVAGGVILLFFVFVITQVQSAQEAKLAAKVISNFDAILSGSQVSPNTLNTIDSSAALKFEISCELFVDDITSELSVPKAYSRQDISRKVVFTPDDLSGKNIFIYVRPIEVPFQVDNAIMLADERTYFFFYNSSSSTQLLDVYDGLPNGFTKLIGAIFPDDLSSFKRVVVVSPSAPNVSAFSYPSITNEKVLRNLNVNWIQIGTLNTTFFYKEAKSTQYANKSYNTSNLNSRLHMMFSKDPAFYDCNVKKIDNRVKIVAQIYNEKAIDLRTWSASQPTLLACKNYYQSAQAQLGPIINYGLTASTTIATINGQLLRASCPLIY